jgi:phosphopantetheinyl transferase
MKSTVKLFMYSLKYNINTCETADLLQKFCPEGSPEITNNDSQRPSLNYRRLIVMALVRRALVDVFHISLKSALAIVITHEESGAPYLVYPKTWSPKPVLHISISHTGPWVAFVLSNFNAPITIDIEDTEKSRSFIQIASSIFSQKEQKYVEKYGNLGFYYLWGTKEVLGKFYKKGLSFALKLDLDDQLCPPSQSASCIIFHDHKKFLLSFVVEDYILITTCTSAVASAD